MCGTAILPADNQKPSGDFVNNFKLYGKSNQGTKTYPIIQQGREKGKGQRTNKQDEDQTRPATHSPKLLRDKGHRGTKDTEGQRTLRDNGH